MKTGGPGESRLLEVPVVLRRDEAVVLREALAGDGETRQFSLGPRPHGSVAGRAMATPIAQENLACRSVAEEPIAQAC